MVSATELKTPRAQEILEEILDLSRINQKLLRNPDDSLGANLEKMILRFNELIGKVRI